MRTYFKKLRTDLEESIRIAIDQLFAHKFRSLLTALGVIIGVWAVILIGVGINGINNGYNKSIEMIGSNNFFVQRWPWKDVGDEWTEYVKRRNMDTDYAAALNDIFLETPNSNIEIAVPVIWINRNISYENNSTERINLMGTNSDFSYINTAEISNGRFFSATEAMGGQNVVILGSDVVTALFPDGAHTAIEKKVKINNILFTVIGTLEAQGKFLGMQSFDRQAIIPLRSMLKFITGNPWWRNVEIRVMKSDDADRELAREEIAGAMRRVRGLEPGEKNDFEVNSSDAVDDFIGPTKTKIAIGGFVITGLSLFVGAVGIMNITFVSVSERTKEIGTRRAIGARKRSILIQFLFESSAICLLGGSTGLILAYLSKMVVSVVAPHFPASFSVDLMIWAFLISISTGILSGFIPALKAAKLDPATALRHE